MVVDDNFFNVGVLTSLLTEFNSQTRISECYNGHQCIDKIEEKMLIATGPLLYDIIFLDINMPQMNGF